MTVQQPSTQRRLQVLLVVHAALVMGVAMFAVVVLTLQQPAAIAGAPLLALRLASMVVLGSAVMLSIVLRRAAISSLANQQPAPVEAEIMNRFAALSLTRAALAEGSALLGVVTLLLSADPKDLIIIGAALFVLAAMAPLPGKWESFRDAVEAQRGRTM